MSYVGIDGTDSQEPLTIFSYFAGRAEAGSPALRRTRYFDGNQKKGVFALSGESAGCATAAPAGSGPPLGAAGRAAGMDAGCRMRGCGSGAARQRARPLLTSAAGTANPEAGHLWRWLRLAPTGVCLNKYLVLCREYRGVCISISMLSYSSPAQLQEYSRCTGSCYFS